MNNQEKYKKAIEQIHASNRLKEETFEKIIPKRKIPYMRYIYVCATLMILFGIGGIYLKQNSLNDTLQNNIALGNKNISEEKINDLPRFSSLEELKLVIKENHYDMRKEALLETALDSASVTNSENKKDSQIEDYSKTNTQVENVDEADIVKTDGKYIYYVTQGKVYIVDAKQLSIVSKIEINEEKKKFSPREIYINKDKLVILGNYYEYENIKTRYEGDIIEDLSRVTPINMAQAIVYDIKNRENPKQIRIVGIDGYYSNSRMIGDMIYLISNKSIYYYEGMKDEEILPILKDTAEINQTRHIQATDIVRFEGSESYNYMMVAGFNIQNNEAVTSETFFGVSNTIYASQNNLYIAQTNYHYENERTTIYKFKLKASQIKLTCKAEIDGYLNNQFSMDEYNGNLRIATTARFNGNSNNQLYILDEELKLLGKIEDMAKGEKIYAVRFIGKTGYIVTFKQIDPLFIIDLEDPSNPQIKGELKIPGYSSYLHPYDEKHIIGIGYNTKTNSSGGVTNTTMKMSMFDVSDLANPKEIFHVDIGNSYTYSDILYNHKQLFYNKEKALIGFPVTYREQRYKDDRNGLVIYRIDLEKGFEKQGEILQEINYKTNINRAIYVEDILYTLAEMQINAYDLNTLEKINQLELDY